MQQSAVDGNQAVINNVALRNVHIQALQTGDFLRPGATVNLVLVAVNQSPDITDKLVGITTDIGEVTVTGDPTLHASGVLFVGSQNGQSKKSDNAVENADSVKATIALSKPITNGPNYDFTFNFEKAGSVSVGVPISAPESAPQHESPGPA
jgi:copper(I)-binding protein